MKRLGEDGFSMLEVIMTVVVLGILASIAIPKFSNATIAANTAKIQTDLQTLDTAIAIYEVEKGTSPNALSDLSEYVNDLDNLRPPKGECNLKKGGTVEITQDKYRLKYSQKAGSTASATNYRAACGQNQGKKEHCKLQTPRGQRGWCHGYASWQYHVRIFGQAHQCCTSAREGFSRNQSDGF